MVMKDKSVKELVDEANAKMDQADEIEESNPKLYDELYDEAGEILDRARDIFLKKCKTNDD